MKRIPPTGPVKVEVELHLDDRLRAALEALTLGGHYSLPGLVAETMYVRLRQAADAIDQTKEPR